MDEKVRKSHDRLDGILLYSFIRSNYDDLKICPACREGFASTCGSPKGGEVTCPVCSFSFCPYCDASTSMHSNKTCIELHHEVTKMTLVDSNTPTCPSCKAPVEKNGGCNHITCKCGYEWCYQCRGPYYKGHLEEHASARITVNVPGEQRPLQITQTPHTVYRLSSSDTSSTVKPTTLAGDDIQKLFREHHVLKLVRIATKDPVTEAVTYKEGILLKRKRQSDPSQASSNSEEEDENASKRLLTHFKLLK